MPTTTKLQQLNRHMKHLETTGDVSEEQYAIYKHLLEAVELLQEAVKPFLPFNDGNNPPWVAKTRNVLEELK